MMILIEALSGLRCASITDPMVGRINNVLHDIYKLYVDWVIKNPLHDPTCITIESSAPLFVTKLTVLIKSLSYCSS
jgi:hypothetical protein